MPIVTLLNAKNNYKYKFQKKKRPRLNKDDIKFYQHFIKESGISFHYDPITNNIEYHIPNPDGNQDSDVVFEMEGTDTGGQVIRWVINHAIRVSKLPRKKLANFEARTEGKAIMLYIQAALLRLEVGDEFWVSNGNPENTDGPNPAFLINLFAILEKILGVSFELLDKSDEDKHRFCLVRNQNKAPETEWSCDEILSTEMVDQILFVSSFYPPTQPLELKCEIKRDYHVDAIIRIMKLINFTVNEDVSVDHRRLVVTPGL